MLRTLRVELKLELGRVNVLIGANGSGKSNVLEALGVLGAAASGRVDDESLLRRGVRPGVPRLYKAAFGGLTKVPHIKFGAENAAGASYEVTLWNPTEDPSPAWRYKTELLRDADDSTVATRSPVSAGKVNQEVGTAALEAIKLHEKAAASALIAELRDYAIYCPNTAVLRGLVQDVQSRVPVGLSGGRLPEAVQEIQAAARKSKSLSEALEYVQEIVDWAGDFGTKPTSSVLLSPSAARSAYVVEFVDRYMMKSRNRLTGYDASEGALYVLCYAALALHPRSPACVAVDNFDQALNPRLAMRLARALCDWTKHVRRQWLVTAHNPAVLDGLPLGDDDIRLFAVDRNNRGHTTVRRIDVASALARRPDDTWTLSRMWMNGLLGAVPNV